MLTYGTIIINFAVKTSKENLLENFDDDLVKMATVNLTNVNDENLTLKVFDHEITHLESEESME